MQLRFVRRPIHAALLANVFRCPTGEVSGKRAETRRRGSNGRHVVYYVFVTGTIRRGIFFNFFYLVLQKINLLLNTCPARLSFTNRTLDGSLVLHCRPRVRAGRDLFVGFDITNKHYQNRPYFFTQQIKQKLKSIASQISPVKLVFYIL